MYYTLTCSWCVGLCFGMVGGYTHGLCFRMVSVVYMRPTRVLFTRVRREGVEWDKEQLHEWDVYKHGVQVLKSML